MKKIIILLLSVVLFAGCFGFSGCRVKTKKDEYTSDGKMIIEYFGINIDALQSRTKTTDRIITYIEDKFGIEFDFVSGGSVDWLGQLNRKIADGDVPDMFFHDAKDPSYTTWREEKYLMDYTPYLNDYPNLKACFESYSPEMKEYLGGAWYGMPLKLNDDVEGYVTNEQAMYYRRDWYENVKDYRPDNKYADSQHSAIKDPEDPTFDYIDFYNLCEAFAKGDPDGNGKDDTYGYAFAGKDTGSYWFWPIFSMFNVAYDGWTKEADGSYSAQIVSDEMKEAVFFMADMYDNRLLASNYSSSLTSANLYTDFATGRFGIMTTSSSYNNSVNILTQQAPNIPEGGDITDVVRGMPIVTGKDGVKRALGVYNFYGFTSVCNDISDAKKEKILQLMNWMLSEEGMMVLEYGLEGEQYEIGENGEIKSLLGIDRNGNANYLYSDEVGPGLFEFKGIVSWRKNNLPKYVPYYEAAKSISDAWGEDFEHLVLNPFMYMRLDPSYNLIETNVKNQIDSCLKNIIASTNNKPANFRENTWNDFVSFFNGETKYIKAVNDWAKENLG